MNTVEYLIKKLEELGINDFFGVSDDYNLEVLYAIEANPNTKWIGCTNSLNAGYSADGYARQRGYGAIVSSYGVGELSTINALAGSYAENVPVVNIVGVPATKQLELKALFHHNFQEPKSMAFSDAYKTFLDTYTFLSRDNAKLEIDRVIKSLVKDKKPVYVALPEDVAKMEVVDRDVNYTWESDCDILKTVVSRINEKIKNSKKPVILGDVLVKRFDAKIEFKEFVEKSGIPTTNFLMGADLLDFSCENYLGTYFSKYKNQIAKDWLENTDCLIAVGTIYSDYNAFGFNLPYKINSHVSINGTHTYIDGVKFDNIKMADVLDGLSSCIGKKELVYEKEDYTFAKTTLPTGDINSEYLFSRVQEFLKENDILIGEVNFIHHGISQMKLPDNVEVQLQTFWESAGWATPATLGACVANPNSRVILITDVKSHQMSAMEIGTILRYGFKPIVLVLNNNISSNKEFGLKEDINEMNYAKFARIFDGEIWSAQVKTQDDFDKALKVSKIMNKLCYIEICIAKDDVTKLTVDINNDFRKEEIVDEKSFIDEDKEINKKRLDLRTCLSVNFATKVHESLKKEE